MRRTRCAALWVIEAFAAVGLSRAQEEDWNVRPLFSLAAADLQTIDVRPLLEAACPGKSIIRHGKRGMEMGCSVCPRGSGLSLDPTPGTLQVSLKTVTFGHFTSATAEDALLSVAGVSLTPVFLAAAFR